MACPSVGFDNVDANVWACLKREAAKQKVIIGPDKGSFSAAGFAFDYVFDPVGKTLSITCTDGNEPMCGFINGKIKSLIQNTGCLP